MTSLKCKPADSTTSDDDASNGLLPLNSLDRGMLTIDSVLRYLGSRSFETQMLVWLDSRADAGRLQNAIAQVSLRYPVMASRLVTDEFGRPFWSPRSGAECLLHEAELGSADHQAVMDFASGLLSVTPKLEDADPIRFHLLHRPDGRDVFVMQYNHVLMDNSATTSLLSEISTIADDPSLAELPAEDAEQHDSIWKHMRKTPRKRRRRAVQGTIDLYRETFRGMSARINPKNIITAIP